MLPAAAILGMRKVLAAMLDSITDPAPAERPDLMTDIDDIWELMGEADVGELDAKYSLEGVEE